MLVTAGGRSAVGRRAANVVVARLLAVLCSDLCFSCLNLRGIGRMVAVANHFLKGGTPKINVTLQQPPTDGSQPSNVIKVVFMPKMEDFNAQSSAAAR